MTARRLALAALAGGLSLSPAGCVGDWEQFRRTQFGDRPVAPDRGSPVPLPEVKAASAAAATRVDSLGRDLLRANPDAAVSPLFVTIGVEEHALFHHGADAVYVTEGLVTACKGDAELSALLAIELARLVVEEQARQARESKLPPVQPALTRDVANAGRTADQTDVAELARFEQSNPRSPLRAAPPPTIQPEELAGVYLAKANLPQAAIERVRPLARAASGRSKIEAQMFAPAPPAPAPKPYNAGGADPAALPSR